MRPLLIVMLSALSFAAPRQTPTDITLWVTLGDVDQAEDTLRRALEVLGWLRRIVEHHAACSGGAINDPPCDPVNAELSQGGPLHESFRTPARMNLL